MYQNRINKVFQDKEQAETAYKQLEINGVRDFALYEVESLFDADQPEQLKSNVRTIFADYDYEDIQLKGSLEDLS
ncbi:hypothetical protein Q674_15465 [Acinetobacter sp. COS3]|nr:hypothetical protein Q674_15465 [Acinetobacter sp. COS3]